MKNTNTYQQLYTRFRAEQDEFENWLRQQPWDTIRHHCYDYGVREDILGLVENEDLDEDDAAVLLDANVTLAQLMESKAWGWVDTLTGVRNVLNSVAWDISLTKKQQQQQQQP